MNKLITALVLCCVFAFGQPRPAVAIRNAKIVTVSGPVIARGTVVVRNGLIEAVGDSVQAPPDAMIIDGEGLSVYPGLIDALSTWGQPGAAMAVTGTATAGRGGRGTVAVTPTPAVTAATTVAAPPARGPEDRPQTTSWIKAADEVSGMDRRIETARGAGFTTAVTFPTRGIFAGQGAVIDLLSGEKPGEMVVASPVGQYISLGRGGFGGGMGGGFPSALMGYIAYVRQIYLDLEHYRLVKDAYAKDPRGMQRPEYDRALEGLMDSPRVLLPANRLVEIDRMLRLAADLKQPAILYGGREAYRPEAAELLKRSNTALLLSMRWPEKSRDADPDEVDSMRTLETRDKAPLAAAVLAKARVRWAFYSDGLEQARDLQRAIKKALDAGLSREDALRALTLSPAEIYGVQERLGSIEKGKIGNLVLTRGDLFDDRTKVEAIIVDGRKYTPAPEAPMGGRGPATEEPGNSGGLR
ncbi:MAG TPA: amidohydrolase family protein [Candidatus Acidoferrales bacterium]|nr:amidohydrolase family protein [Candidatus Acidoferrales bacterium]